jgi:hypothetical protein
MLPMPFRPNGVAKRRSRTWRDACALSPAGGVTRGEVRSSHLLGPDYLVETLYHLRHLLRTGLPQPLAQPLD